MKNWLQPLFRLHLATVLSVGAGALVLLLANTWPFPKVLGHVSSSEPPIAPGLWIHGDDYGWPWVYKRESFKTEAVPFGIFERFDRLSLVANATVGLAILLGIAVYVESAMRKRSAQRGGLPTT
jgi:hypothetical protein